MKITSLPRLFALIIAAGISAPALAQDLSSGRLIDLTHPFNEKSVYWPTAETFKKTKVFHGHTTGGWFYSAFNFSAAEHGGTHMDAPVHFAQGRMAADQVPVSQLIGPGVVIDVTKQSAANVDYLVGPSDFAAHERVHGRIPRGAIVLINTGRAHLYPDRKKYMGTAERGESAVPKLHFPGLSKEGAQLLLVRRVGAVGIDTPSIDYGQSEKFEAHVTLMRNNIPAFENVADMSSLPSRGFTVIALPMKIEGGSGGPLRIVAHVPGG